MLAASVSRRKIGPRQVLEEIELLRPQFSKEVVSVAALRRSHQLVGDILESLKFMTDDERRVRSTFLWALCVLAELNPKSKEVMLELGMAGLLMDVLRGAEEGAVDLHYAKELGLLLSVDLVRGQGKGDSSNNGSAFLPYIVRPDIARSMHAIFGDASIDATRPITSMSPLQRFRQQPRTMTTASHTSHQTAVAIYGAKTAFIRPATTVADQGRRNPSSHPTPSSVRRRGRSQTGVREQSARSAPLSLSMPQLRGTTLTEKGIEKEPLELPHHLDPLFQRVAQSIAHPQNKALDAEVLKSKDGVAIRIPAQELATSDFMRLFFVEGVSLQAAQKLIGRLSTLVRVVDKEVSGFVTWGTFSDILLALAPPAMLRSTVLDFLQAQTDSPDHLVDYNEFIITGKILILDEFCHKQELMR